jgi:predicted phosphodiesterase
MPRTIIKKIRTITKKPKADLVLAADIHLRPDVPMCRLDKDNFHNEMFSKFEQLLSLGSQNECPVIIAGDFGHGSGSKNWQPWLLSKVIDITKEYYLPICVIPGQHDLPNHQLDRLEESGIWTLHKASAIQVLNPSDEARQGYCQIKFFPYGQPIKSIENLSGKQKKVAVAHQMVIQSMPEWPGQKADKAKALLEKFNYDLIVTGDNHNQFVVKHKGKILVNPGSMMRMRSDQIDHKPAFYLYYAKTNEIERIPLTEDSSAVSVDHIKNTEQREKRLSAFVESLQEYFEIGLSYTDNVKKAIQENDPGEDIKKFIWEALEDK